jgi:uncharacterized protein DUF5677
VDTLIRNLLDIAKWLASAPDPRNFESEADFMRFLVEAMGRALYLLRVGVSLAPNDRINERGYLKRHAVIVGHMVRLVKLFDGFYLHTAKRQLEVAGVMQRLIAETEVRLAYLLTKANSHSYKSYVMASYRADRESLVDLEAKAKVRKLIPIEKRIRGSILKHIRRDGISRKRLLQNKTWEIDGKNFRALLNELGRGSEYSYLFGNSSRWVHGTWQKLYHYHLKKVGSRFLPRLDFGDPDTRTAAPITAVCLDTLLLYFRWSKPIFFALFSLSL